ncbi:MAG TPA: hypothetical protein VGJ60_07430 [Chloroflexota bacterium]|jgi:hypothetical protein
MTGRDQSELLRRRELDNDAMTLLGRVWYALHAAGRSDKEIGDWLALKGRNIADGRIPLLWIAENEPEGQ